MFKGLSPSHTVTNHTQCVENWICSHLKSCKRKKIRMQDSRCKLAARHHPSIVSRQRVMTINHERANKKGSCVSTCSGPLQFTLNRNTKADDGLASGSRFIMWLDRIGLSSHDRYFKTCTNEQTQRGEKWWKDTENLGIQNRKFKNFSAIESRTNDWSVALRRFHTLAMVFDQILERKCVF